MKIFKIIPLAIVALFFMQCKKDENTEMKKEVKEEKDTSTVVLNYSAVQRAIIQDFTSTGCPGCGSWGAPTFEKFAQDNKEVIPVAVHIKYNDPMITDESNALGANRVGRKWTPQISVGTTQCVILSPNNLIDGAGSVKMMEDEFKKITTSQTKVELAAQYKVEGEELVLNYGLGYVDTTQTDEYHIAAYVMEDGIVARQASGKDPYIHNHVIRSSDGGAFGQLVPVKGGKSEFKKTFSLDPSWNKDKLYAIVVVWKPNGNVFLYENAMVAEKQ